MNSIGMDSGTAHYTQEYLNNYAPGLYLIAMIDNSRRYMSNMGF